MVVDCKAAASAFNADWPSLRALREYTSRQIERQRGHADVVAAMVVSSKFTQGSDALLKLSARFAAHTTVPVCFLTAEDMIKIVGHARHQPSYRNALRWADLLIGGVFSADDFANELDLAQRERAHSP